MTPEARRAQELEAVANRERHARYEAKWAAELAAMTDPERNNGPGRWLCEQSGGCPRACLLHKARLISEALGIEEWGTGTPREDELWAEVRTCLLPGYGRFEPEAPTLTAVRGKARTTKRRAGLAVVQ